jgi:hypothetical protein
MTDFKEQFLSIRKLLSGIYSFPETQKIIGCMIDLNFIPNFMKPLGFLFTRNYEQISIIYSAGFLHPDDNVITTKYF